jgi:hypothetical protein
MRKECEEEEEEDEQRLNLNWKEKRVSLRFKCNGRWIWTVDLTGSWICFLFAFLLCNMRNGSFESSSQLKEYRLFEVKRSNDMEYSFSNYTTKKLKIN